MTDASSEKLGSAVGIVEKVGIASIGYHDDPILTEPVLKAEAAKGGLLDSFLDTQGAAGMSLYPVGILVKEGASPTTPKHESYHFQEQREEGFWDWYGGYLSEFAGDSVRYLDYDAAYYNNSYEERARIYSGEEADRYTFMGW